MSAAETHTFSDYTNARRIDLFPHHVDFYERQVAAAEAKLRAIGIDPQVNLFTDRQWFGVGGIIERNGIAI